MIDSFYFRLFNIERKFIKNIKSIPTCKICNKYVNFKNSDIGYNVYCSNKCLSKDKEIVNKRKNTSINRFGTDKPQQLDIIKQKTIDIL